MAHAESVNIAEAVLALVRDAPLSQAFELERSDAEWDLELEEAGCLRVDVVAVSTEQEAALIAHDTIELSVPIDIAIRRRFAPEFFDDKGRVAQQYVDQLKYLTQEIFLLMMPTRLPDFESSVWESTKILVCPERKHLREFKQFTSILRITFLSHLSI